MEKAEEEKKDRTRPADTLVVSGFIGDEFQVETKMERLKAVYGVFVMENGKVNVKNKRHSI